ncbi:MAG: 5'-methylthioadenosine nucleosidase [Planctomycetales bacterium]
MSEASLPQPDFRQADVACVVALPMEAAPLLKKCQRVNKYSGGKFVFRGGRYGHLRLAIVECGMGFARARQGTLALIDAHAPKWILSIGFSGALLPEMKIGDIVVGNSLADLHGTELKIDLNMPEDRAGGRYVGKLLTADAIIRTVEEKRQLHARTNALAVDLESLAVAQVCQEHRTRFMAVRVISDDLRADLPPEVLSLTGNTGAIRWGATLGALWKRPASVGDMWKMWERSNQAAEKLAEFLDGVLAQLPIDD